jgi:hypothetical protein
MGKYSPLREYLRNQHVDSVPMTFSQIEKVLEQPLPPSKKYPAWWSNNPSNNVMTKEWLAAGFQTESVDVASEKLVFRRVLKDRPTSNKGSPPRLRSETPSVRPAVSRHPVEGCLSGTLTIRPGVDLTEPADPNWGKVYEDQ